MMVTAFPFKTFQSFKPFNSPPSFSPASRERKEVGVNAKSKIPELGSAIGRAEGRISLLAALTFDSSLQAN